MSNETIIACMNRKDQCEANRKELESLRKMKFVSEWKKMERVVETAWNMMKCMGDLKKLPCPSCWNFLEEALRGMRK